MRISTVLPMLLLLIMVSVSAHAAGLTSSAGQLDFSAKLDTGDSMDPIGLSPKVQAYYVSNGTTVTASQWYAVSTGHPGGNKVFATAQDVNNVYTKDYTTAAEMSTYLQSIPTTGQSASLWTDGSDAWDL